MFNKIKFRAITSSLLIINFVVLTFTGIGLYLSPSGYITKATAWTFLGISKFKLENLHAVFGFILIALLLIHLFLNYKMFFNEFKILFK